VIVELGIAQRLHRSAHGVQDMYLGMGMEQGVVNVKHVQTAHASYLVQRFDVF
jgi:hypothetical protein